MYRISDLFDLTETYPEAGAYLKGFTYPWEALSGIQELILKIGERLSPEEFDHPSETVWIAKTAKVFPSAYVGEYVIIGKHSEVRHSAFIRGNALIGEHVTVGNSTELKNVILFNKVQVPHYNYVGDSILGCHAHMGAGSVTSNVKGDKTTVVVKDGTEKIETGRKKVGAFLGDRAEIGCNSVLNPGTVIGKNAQVYPLSSVRGTVPENSIYKHPGEIVEKRPADH